MNKVNLKELRNHQEIPIISLKPIKTFKDKMYFLKFVQDGKYEQYIEGIYCYENNELKKVDSGFHTLMPKDYDIYSPFLYDDIAIYEDMDYILFSIVALNKNEKGKANIIINAIDVKNNTQIEVFSIKYSISDFLYAGFRILSDTYILIELENAYNEEAKEYNKMFLLNIYTNEFIELKDNFIKYTDGMITMDVDSNYLYIEENYMSEEDETAILTTDMYELDNEGIEQSELNPFINSVKYISLKKLIKQCSNPNIENYDFEYIDSIDDTGIIRVVGTTKENIYYKKSKHQNILKTSKEFMDRVLLGKEEIYAVNKSSLEKTKVTNLELGYIFAFDMNIFHKIVDSTDNIKIINVDTGKVKYIYEKAEKIEEFSDFVYDRYIMIGINDAMSSKKYVKVVDIKSDEIYLKAKEVYFVADTIFYEPL